MKNLIFISLILFAFSCNHDKTEKCERGDESTEHSIIWEDFLMDTTIYQFYAPHLPIFIYNNSLIYPKKTDSYNNTKIVKRDLYNNDEHEEIVAEGLWKDFVVHKGKLFYTTKYTLKSIDLELMKSEYDLNFEEEKNTLLNGLDDNVYINVLGTYGADTLLKQEIQSYDINTKEAKAVFSKIYSIVNQGWYYKMVLPTIWKTKEDEIIMTYLDVHKKYTPTGIKEQIKLVSVNLANQQELFKIPVDSVRIRGIKVESGHIVLTKREGSLSNAIYVYNGLTGVKEWSKSGALCHLNPENKSILASDNFNLYEYSIDDGKILSKGQTPVTPLERNFHIKDDDIFYLPGLSSVERLKSGSDCSQLIFKLTDENNKLVDIEPPVAYDKNNSVLYLRSNKKIFAIDLK